MGHGIGPAAGRTLPLTGPPTASRRRLAIGVIALSLFIGLIIWLMDLILQTVLVRGIPSLFGR